MYKAAIFDLDGVLLDTEYYQWKGWVEPLKKLGYDLSKEEYILDYAGKSGLDIEKKLIEKFGLELLCGELLEKKEKLLMNV